ncbi:MAG: hypoxanthine phosphoribosyltransferase [Simkaniaceae bacterium]|nr:hypoxanthine phosphoribosyltransferase [Candidatus Sacchlamyda saccharinae]
MQILISEEEIAKKVAAVAEELNAHYVDQEVILVTILKGGICFVADLIRHLTFPFQLEFVTCASYGMRGTKPGELTLSGFDNLDIKDKHVLLIDDIYDTGQTLSRAYHTLAAQSPTSVRSSVLLRKKITPKGDITPDFVCFDIEDHFVVGYGLDHKEHLRGLKAIHVYG